MPQDVRNMQIRGAEQRTREQNNLPDGVGEDFDEFHAVDAAIKEQIQKGLSLNVRNFVLFFFPFFA